MGPEPGKHTRETRFQRIARWSVAILITVRLPRGDSIPRETTTVSDVGACRDMNDERVINPRSNLGE